MKIYASTVSFVFFLMLMAVPIYHSSSGNENCLSIVNKSLEVSKANFEELNIQAWAQINNKALSYKEINEVFDSIINDFNMKNEDIKCERSDGFIQLYNKKKINGDIIEISLQSVKESEFDGTYLGIQVKSPIKQKAQKLYGLVNNQYEKFTVKADIGITFIGNYDGYLEEMHKYRLIAAIFGAINAKVIEGISNEILLSFSGFTNKCPFFIVVDDKKININIALRYHELDNKTYIHIGSPLIFQEY